MALLPAIILFSTILPLGLFLAYFALRSQWYTSKIGRIILGLAMSLMAMLCIGLIQYLFAPDWLDVVRVIVYFILNLGVWKFFITLRHVQRAKDDGTLEPTDLQKVWGLIARRKRPRD